MITGAAFCPHPPLLVPEVAQGAADEVAGLRAACRTVINRVAAHGSQLIVIGAGPRWQPHESTARGSLAAFGVDREIPLGSDDAAGAVELPLSLTVGAWLLRDDLGPDSGATGWSVGPGPGSATLPDGPVALLVMGDGSARRGLPAPGHLDERAAAFDAATAAALRGGQPGALRTDVALGDELLAAGPRAWNAAADLLAGRSWAAELLYEDAPYGVGYFVAAWTPR